MIINSVKVDEFEGNGWMDRQKFYRIASIA